MWGPFIPPTIIKRRGGITLPKESSLSVIHCFTMVSIFSDEKSLISFNTDFNSVSMDGVSSFHCFLTAFSSKEVQEDVIKDIRFIKHQANTIDNAEDFRKELERTYHRGYSIDNNEMEEGIFCIGAPIFDADDKVIATVSASGLQNPNMDIEYESIELKKTALLISRELGYTGR